MADQNTSTLTTSQLIIGFIAALLIGIALTVFVILPAETGQDPTGFGETTGLDQLAEPEIAEEVTVTAAPAVTIEPDTLYVAIDPETAEPTMDDFGRSLPFVDGLNIQRHPTGFKTETIDVEIGLDGQVEYKAIMDQGQMLHYSWETEGDVYYDFHAHQAEGNPDFWTRYAEGESNSDHGSIVAPYQGQHGWFWLNISDSPITVKLTVAGYYDEVIEIDMNAYPEESE